jgi:small subunit ribosomal protein S20
MANSAQAKKRARQNVKQAICNKSRISQMRTSIKNTVQTATATDATKEKITASLCKTVSSIDKNADKNLIHKNKAARLKSRLNKKLKKLTAAK